MPTSVQGPGSWYLPGPSVMTADARHHLLFRGWRCRRGRSGGCAGGVSFRQRKGQPKLPLAGPCVIMSTTRGVCTTPSVRGPGGGNRYGAHFFRLFLGERYQPPRLLLPAAPLCRRPAIGPNKKPPIDRWSASSLSPRTVYLPRAPAAPRPEREPPSPSMPANRVSRVRKPRGKARQQTPALRSLGDWGLPASSPRLRTPSC